MQSTGKITKILGPKMLVQIDAAHACDGCSGDKGCGAGYLFNIFNRRKSTCQLPKLAGSSPGDRVQLQIADSVLLKLAFTGYLMPVLSLLAAAMFADIVIVPGAGSGSASLIVSVCGVAGFIGGLIAYKPVASYVCSLSDTPITATGILSVN